jgi:hypothetical protein
VTGPARGTLVEVTGAIAAPYGQTEVRAPTGAVRILGTDVVPTARRIDAGDAGEATEGRLLTVRGTVSVSAAKATSGDLVFTIEGEDGVARRVSADASAGLDATRLRKGLVATFTGVLGQRASRKGALDGYRVWLRDAADVSVIAQPGSSASPTATASPAPAAAAVIAIAAARQRDGQQVTVEGVLTIDRTLLDASGRRTVVEDASGAIELYLAAPDAALHAGVRVRATGTVGQAYGAARLRVEAVRALGTATPTARELRRAAGAADEWRLVRVSGTIVDVHRLGERWLAELDLGSVRVPVSGLAGSGIPGASVVEGRRATVAGIVRRPYPTATDRRFAVVPRSAADLALGAPAATGPAGSGATTPVAGASSAPGSGSPGGGGEAPDVDLARLGDHVGRVVRVGGLVAELQPDGAILDDGTATARLVLEGDAAGLAALLEPGDALNATGTVELRDGETGVVVAKAADLALAGAPVADAADAAAATAQGGLLVPRATGGAAVRAGLARDMVLDPASAGLGTLLLVVTMSVLVTAARRHRGRRLLQARVAARLEALSRPASAAAADSHRDPG